MRTKRSRIKKGRINNDLYKSAINNSLLGKLARCKVTQDEEYFLITEIIVKNNRLVFLMLYNEKMYSFDFESIDEFSSEWKIVSERQENNGNE